MAPLIHLPLRLLNTPQSAQLLLQFGRQAEQFINLVTPPTGLLAITFHLQEYPFTYPTAGNLGGLMLEQELCLCGCIGSTGC